MTESTRWGGKLPPRGYLVAHLLNSVANVTLPRKQRMGDAERLADVMNLTPHAAWQLACTTAVALGYGPRTSDAWKQIAYHTLPGGFPTAEAWLLAAGLDDEGYEQGARPVTPTYYEPPPPPDDDYEDV